MSGAYCGQVFNISNIRYMQLKAKKLEKIPPLEIVRIANIRRNIPNHPHMDVKKKESLRVTGFNKTLNLLKMDMKGCQALRDYKRQRLLEKEKEAATIVEASPSSSEEAGSGQPFNPTSIKAQSSIGGTSSKKSSSPKKCPEEKSYSNDGHAFTIVKKCAGKHPSTLKGVTIVEPSLKRPKLVLRHSSHKRLKTHRLDPLQRLTSFFHLPTNLPKHYPLLPLKPNPSHPTHTLN